LPFEDIRDMVGDRAIGRRTFALMVGHWPVRITFAMIMFAIPVVLYLLLFSRSHATPGAVWACGAVVAVMS
jgi:4-hydroxybenzoate polyprenyltransferase